MFSFLSMKPTVSISVLSSQRHQDVSSFFLRVQLSQLYVATGQTSAFISHIFVEIGTLWLFHIFCNDAQIACPLFNMVQNSVVHLPSSVIRDPRYGNVSTCSSCSFLPSMLWRCWLGGRKGIQPVKNWVVGCWHGYLSGERCRLAYGPADATATHCFLLQ